ncbi:hypothetical protein [Maribacter sp. IgM3_T14_3]|uniref:hypothetical protein n=1 Tax=Maribacter sp. IgM3_T14_3 TaxID=3415140 RepID=UPI003C6FDC2E
MTLYFLTFKITIAHNPLSVMNNMDVKTDFAILNVSLSQAGLHHAMVAFYSKQDLEKISKEDYKKLAVDYIKKHFELNINTTAIAILDGGIKLGSHQTDFKFISSKLPEAFDKMDLKIDAFAQNGHHQTIFALLLNGITGGG